MTCTLICQKQCLYSGSNMLLLLHSKVNTRTTKAGGVSKFLLGREVVNSNSSKWRVNKEGNSLLSQIHKSSITYIWYRRHFNLWSPQPQNVKCFSIQSNTSGFLLKRNTLRGWKSCLLKGNLWRRVRGGNVEIKKLCRTLFNCN